MRWRTVSGGGRAPEPARLKRSGRPERTGFLERRSLGREEPRASTEGASTAGKKPDRDGFGRPGPARRLSPTAREKGRPAQLPRRKMPSGRHPKERQGPALIFRPAPAKPTTTRPPASPTPTIVRGDKTDGVAKSMAGSRDTRASRRVSGCTPSKADGENVLRFAEIILPGCATLPAGAGVTGLAIQNALNLFVVRLPLGDSIEPEPRAEPLTHLGHNRNHRR